MGNIWEFLYQTLSVSLCALVLLAVKWLLRDKLSPRWQYAVWAILALRALVPASNSRGVIPQLSLWLETAKSAAELSLDSAYTSAFGKVDMSSVLLWPGGTPVSVTDWLFIVYAAGAAATLLWYAVNYARLRALLRRGSEPGAAVREAIASAAEKYGLKPCRAVAVPGLKSAFVCGVIRPVLAVPEGEAPDEKVLLHELLHLKYRDALQSVFWCLLRALHWCNPFMQYVFDRVGNDMESLCDQRVLERLEGEERREYGAILLGMANSSYARAPGTSSISNGAKNIARRIEAIARFKLYPRGMALVSVCVALVLGSTLLIGASADMTGYLTSGSGTLAGLAATRINRCDSLSGAVDLYAHGVADSNVLYIAAAAPSSEQEHYYDLISRGESPVDPELETALEEVRDYRGITMLTLYNLRSDGEGGYLATLDLAGDWVDSVTSNIMPRHILIPVYISDADGWTVQSCGEARVIDKTDIFFQDLFREYVVYASAPCAGGRIEAGFYTEYEFYSFGAEPDINRTFDGYSMMHDIRFYRDDWVWNGERAHTVSVAYQKLDEYDPDYDLSSLAQNANRSYVSSAGSGANTVEITDDTSGYIPSSGGTGGSVDKIPVPAPEGLAVCVFVDGELEDGVVLKLEAVK